MILGAMRPPAGSFDPPFDSFHLCMSIKSHIITTLCRRVPRVVDQKGTIVVGVDFGDILHLFLLLYLVLPQNLCSSFCLRQDICSSNRNGSSWCWQCCFRVFRNVHHLFFSLHFNSCRSWRIVWVVCFALNTTALRLFLGHATHLIYYTL